MKKFEINPKCVAVYCSSYSGLSSEFVLCAEKIGAGIAAKGFELVYGGTDCGLMGVVAKFQHNNGGKITGIIPTFMINGGLKSNLCDNLIEVPDMALRKSAMVKQSGAFFILPGGLGTLDELFDVLVLKQLQIHNKPVILLNINDYYKPVFEMIDKGISEGTIKKDYLSLMHFADSADEALALI
ncbi:MAG: TIGR00730 family Rossman fold protein [Candidatus Riflebacteria bacterium]|nr:TIGR00730 family Rossman fold protein [Candidatus Riflebacteria bacterium]